MITIAAGARFYVSLGSTAALSLGAHLSEIFASDKDDSMRVARCGLKM